MNLPFLPFAIQPTEFLKFSLIIYLAFFFKKYKHLLHTFSDGFLPFCLIIGIVLLLVGLQPDFGTIMVVIPVAVIMFFMAGANIKYLLSLIVI
ncbi:MAG: FtsW/RodA/SpoVE family cell cycle protein [Candidatus Peribacteria bacterium]|nr:MAG: FtsW/RodA/SpoVE family cell cycle protein [Candidatus Peribacteria bacterium]